MLNFLRQVVSLGRFLVVSTALCIIAGIEF